ncbi:hypothetical protein Syn19_176 [Synechococcus phage Syn19]|uniref:Gp186 n=1 Tax=Synechococcus phage Syn19 TaxID=445684 RepID=E3SQE1_9CAUD|nr:hypothetical protein Syn19_176 [Synechococcus phage Syn19]ADO99381.1 hypothetical protein Syn19_176 [Synechococcus phage Syn19]
MMLSFNELQEKKSKIKINPKKEDVMEGSCGSYSKGGEVKKNHGEDCDCQKCEKKRRKEDLGDEKTVSTEELAYDSQEKVSEEGNQEIAETEIKNLLTFDELQYAKTLNEEQLQEFLKGLFGGANRNAAALPTSSSSGQMPNHGGLASRLGQRRQMMNKAMGKTDTKVLGFSKGGKVKKEEVEQVNEMGGIMKAMKAVGSRSPINRSGMGQSGNPMSGSSGGISRSSSAGGSGGLTSTPGGGTGGASSAPMNASMAALRLSKGGKVKKKSYKESLEIFEKRKELSIDDQMRISREAAAKRKPYQPGDREKQRAAQLKAAAKNAKKDTRTDAEKMTDATGPRPGSRYRGD